MTRGQCRRCARQYLIRADGMVRAHDQPTIRFPNGRTLRGPTCAGSSLPPAVPPIVCTGQSFGPIDLTWCDGVNALERDWIGGPGGGSGAPHPFVDWVVTGGESGPGFRPSNPDWFRSIRDQCVEAGVAYLHKQNGGRTPKSNGRELDERTWDEYPNPSR